MNSEDVSKTISTVALCASAAATSYFTGDSSVWIVVAIISWFVWSD